MGEYADMLLDGTCCEGCGEIMDDHDSPGYVRYCESCKPRKPRAIPNISKRKADLVPCQVCGKKLTEFGMKQHLKDKHGLEGDDTLCQVCGERFSKFQVKQHLKDKHGLEVLAEETK